MDLTSENGQISRPPDTVWAAAFYYHAQSFAPVPVPLRTKKCVLEGWPRLRPTAERLAEWFPPGKEQNIGLLNGEPSGGLVDADLDSITAMLAASFLLPKTGMVSGHSPCPRSHLWYIVDDPSKVPTREFIDPVTGEMMCESRSTGSMTVAPPGVHKETGEKIAWAEWGPPARMNGEEFFKAIGRVAAASLLARHWRGEGQKQGRHHKSLHLAGGLLRAGWSVEEAEAFVNAVTAAANDEEPKDRLNSVRTTQARIEAGQRVTAWKSLAKALPDGPAIVTQVVEWLGIGGRKGSGGGDDTSQVDTLLAITHEKGVQLFHNAGQACFASMTVKGHRETWPFKSVGFRRWLRWRFYQLKGKAPSAQAVTDAVATLDGLAAFEGPEREVHNRLAGHDGKIYLDLADPDWRAIEIGAAGWRVVPQPPVLFRRDGSTLALPVPERGGSLDDLKKFLNVQPEHWPLVLGWVVCSLRPTGPFPLLAVVGEAGTAKTSMGKALQQLIDPTKGGLRGDPSSARDLMISASHSWLLAYDNLGWMPPWLSDAFCRLSTGGGFGTRQLFTDEDEIVFESERPLLLTSVSDVVVASDLLDRTYAVALEPIADERRKTEAELEADFEQARPRLLGALCDALSAGLRNLPHVKLEKLPRMADACRWGESCLRSVGFKDGTFYNAVVGNREVVNSVALESCLVTPILLRPTGFTFKGPAAELLLKINELASPAMHRMKGWPTRPQLLSAMLRKAAPNLRRVGVKLEFSREGKNGRRVIHLEKAAESASAASAASATTAKSVAEKGLEADAPGGPGRQPAVRPSSADHPPEGQADEADDPLTTGRRSTASGASAPSLFPANDLGSPADAADDVSANSSRVMHTLVGSVDELTVVRQALDETEVVGLDTETTGLNPRTDKIRLLQLATDRAIYLIDMFTVPPDALAPVFEMLGQKEIVGHNLQFDLAFLNGIGFTPGNVNDTMLLSQVLDGGRRPRGYHSLAEVAGRELGVTLDKEQQRSDWSGMLTPRQLAYAANDAAVLVPLHDSLLVKIRAAGLARVADIERTCLPAMVWLATSGTPLDVAAWQGLARDADREAQDLQAQLAALAPVPPEGGEWNWNSPQQVKQAFALAGVQLEKTGDEVLATVAHPLAALLRRYRAAKKRAGTYGTKWQRHVSDDGRVYAGWRQLGSDAGRMSCASPNLQQMPRDPAYRRCVRAPEGRVLVKADYSQIELRLAAKISGDRAMLDAYARGDDLHTLTARAIAGKSRVTKGDRQLAKAVNFGLLYGAGPRRLMEYARSSYGVEMTLDQAEQYRESFFGTYAGLRAWHRSTPEGEVECRTLAGRRRCGIVKFTEKLNTPVQGSGADGLKQALALLWERRGQCPGAFPILVVHDEIVVECDAGQAESAAAWVSGAMADGMRELLDPVPCEVEVTITKTWGGEA
jgi:DNA polymerase-1